MHLKKGTANRETPTTRSAKTLLYSFRRLAFYLLLGAFFFSSAQACTPDPPPTLNYKDRKLVDSLFRKEVDSLKPMLDSLCEIRFDSSVQHTVDSLMKVRQSEIDKYLERLKKEMNEN